MEIPRKPAANPHGPRTRFFRLKLAPVITAACAKTETIPGTFVQKGNNIHRSPAMEPLRQSQPQPQADFRQQCLYFFPLPHGHGSLRPTFGVAAL